MENKFATLPEMQTCFGNCFKIISNSQYCLNSAVLWLSMPMTCALLCAGVDDLQSVEANQQSEDHALRQRVPDFYIESFADILPLIQHLWCHIDSRVFLMEFQILSLVCFVISLFWLIFLWTVKYKNKYTGKWNH